MFFNPKREKCRSTSPHVGLAMLAGVLKKSGHTVLIVDYQFKHAAPEPGVFLKEFNPDIAGISLYTASIKEADKIISKVFYHGIPIIVGGPHATLYYEELKKDNRIKYIFRGESENTIIKGFNEQGFSFAEKVILPDPPDPDSLPFPDFTVFYKYEDIQNYPLLTSRGCPHNCSFCIVRLVSTQKWRCRTIESCISELANVKKILPELRSVTIYDDNPMVKKEHIYNFLRLYIDAKFNLPLTIINTRADSLDEQIIKLLKEASCSSIALGVDHGDAEVFKLIGKGETLDNIKKTAELIIKYNIPLCLCFIIGLEEDSIIKSMNSIKFAKSLNASHIYWNLIVPYKGSKIRDWYDRNGEVFNVVNHSSWVDGDILCDEPCAETQIFKADDRKKVYYTAILETNDIRLRIWHIFRLIPKIIKYNLYKQLFYWFPRQLKKDIIIARLLWRKYSSFAGGRIAVWIKNKMTR